MRFWLSGLSMTTVIAFSTPTRLGSIQQPPQPGTRPRKTSGSATAGTPALIVRYVAESASSTPPPMAAPLTNAKVGTGRSAKAAYAAWPARAISSAWSRDPMNGTPVRSAPTAKTNGLPVTADGDDLAGLGAGAQAP